MQFDQELVLRFYAFKNNRSIYKHDVGPFIDNFAERISGADDPPAPFDYASEESTFLKTFKVLAASTAELSFTFANKSGTELTRGFSAYHFEGVTLGLQASLSSLDPSDSRQMANLKQTLTNARLSAAFKSVSSGGGRNSPGPLKDRIELIEKAVSGMST